MYQERFSAYYKIGRFIFILALAISFQITGYFHIRSFLTYAAAAYGSIAFIRLIVKSQRGTFLDMVLDVVFITVIIHATDSVYSFLSIFYLFPVFLSSLLLSQKASALLACTAAGAYGAAFAVHSGSVQSEDMLNVLLHLLSFLLIALAGTYLRDRLDRQEDHIRQLEEEKIAMQGYERLFRVSADFAHELRNPLASISGAVQFLEKGRTDRVFIEMLSTETRRLSGLIDDFLIFARPSDAPRETVDLAEIIRELASQYADRKAIRTDIDGVPAIQANRRLIEIAVNNVLKNAVEAARSTVICALSGDERAGDTVRNALVLSIDDDGPGISDSVKQIIFEPFFTTKKEGTGLGLAIAYRILTAFNGTIRVEKSALGGARFVLSFAQHHVKEH